MNFYKTGDQIVYIPGHANGDRNHPDTERGFVMGQRENAAALCRFWRRDMWGTLRTTANGEWTNHANLSLCASGPQMAVDLAIKTINAGEELSGRDFFLEIGA